MLVSGRVPTSTGELIPEYVEPSTVGSPYPSNLRLPKPRPRAPDVEPVPAKTHHPPGGFFVWKRGFGPSQTKNARFWGAHLEKYTRREKTNYFLLKETCYAETNGSQLQRSISPEIATGKITKQSATSDSWRVERQSGHIKKSFLCDDWGPVVDRAGLKFHPLQFHQCFFVGVWLVLLFLVGQKLTPFVAQNAFFPCILQVKMFEVQGALIASNRIPKRRWWFP